MHIVTELKLFHVGTDIALQFSVVFPQQEKHWEEGGLDVRLSLHQ
jgi:hypothetical protein